LLSGGKVSMVVVSGGLLVFSEESVQEVRARTSSSARFTIRKIRLLSIFYSPYRL
jgi:hypothetical protein